MALTEEIFQRLQEIEKQRTQILKEVIKYGEEFLKKYEVESITLCGNDKLKEITKDLKIKMIEADEVGGVSYFHYRSPIDENLNRDVYLYQDSNAKVGLAYIIAQKLFRMASEKRELKRFEFPLSMSTQFTTIEKAFAYSIIIPYSMFITTMEITANIEIENLDSDVLNNMMIRRICNNLAMSYCCSYEMAYIIQEFYWSIFFDELLAIWKNYTDLMEKSVFENFQNKGKYTTIKYDQWIKEYESDKRKKDSKYDLKFLDTEKEKIKYKRATYDEKKEEETEYDELPYSIKCIFETLAGNR